MDTNKNHDRRRQNINDQLVEMSNIGKSFPDISIYPGHNQTVAAYMRYYNFERLHTTNGDQSPINYENSLKKVSGRT